VLLMVSFVACNCSIVLLLVCSSIVGLVVMLFNPCELSGAPNVIRELLPVAI
jgi:hypothetical protein